MRIGIDRRIRSGAAIAVTGLVLATGVGACGGSDDSGDGTAKQSAAEQLDDGTPAGAVRALYAEFIDAMYAKNTASICSMLSPAAKRNIGDGTDCEGTFKKYLSRVKLAANKPSIVRLKLNGERAKAIVKTKNSNEYPVPFAKIGDDWKINGGFQ